MEQNKASFELIKVFTDLLEISDCILSWRNGSSFNNMILFNLAFYCSLGFVSLSIGKGLLKFVSYK